MDTPTDTPPTADNGWATPNLAMFDFLQVLAVYRRIDELIAMDPLYP